MSVQYFKTAAQPAFTGVAVTTGPVEWIAPFPGVTQKVFFRQRFQQDISTWTGLALDTAHGVLASYLLVKEDSFTDLGGGQHSWYRYYATTPPQRVEYTSYSAQFPGIYGPSARDPIASVTQARITLDYFLVSGSVPTLQNESRMTFSTFFSSGSAPLLSNVFLASWTDPTPSGYLGAIGSGSYPYRPEPQTLERWEGNFYARRTIEVEAK